MGQQQQQQQQRQQQQQHERQAAAAGGGDGKPSARLQLLTFFIPFLLILISCNFLPINSLICFVSSSFPPVIFLFLLHAQH